MKSNACAILLFLIVKYSMCDVLVRPAAGAGGGGAGLAVSFNGTLFRCLQRASTRNSCVGCPQVKCRSAASQWRRKRAIAGKEYETEDRGRRTEAVLSLDSVTVELVGRASGNNATQRPRVSMESNSSMHTELLDKFKVTWPVQAWVSSGMFDEKYLELINTHWLQFPPPSPAVDYTLGGLYILLMLVGCSGNALVVFMYIRCRSLRTPGNILVVNLAVSDFFMLAKTPVFIINSFYLGPVLGRVGCTVYGFLGGLTGTTSIATLSAIAFDRYSVVVRPLDPLKTLSHLRAKLLTVFTWFYACTFSIVPALDFGYGRYVPEGYLTSCSFDYLSDEPNPRYFIFVFFCAAWVAPFSIIAFCYLKILRVVVSARNIAKNSEHRLSTRHVKEQAKRKAELKLAGLVVAVIVLFFLSWTPYAIVALIGIFGKKDIIVPIYSMVPALFCKTASCINPFIYIMSHPKFKSEFQKIVCRKRTRRSSGMMRTTVPGGKSQRRDDGGKEISSEDDVEVLEMRDIPQGTVPEGVATVAARVSDASFTSRKSSNNSFDSEAMPPPSWFKKPRFSQKRYSFQRSSSSLSSIKKRPDTT